jgi:hypothetical protein
MSALYFRTLDRTQQACCAVSNKRDLWVERTTRTGENRKSYLSTTFLKVFYAPPPAAALLFWDLYRCVCPALKTSQHVLYTQIAISLIVSLYSFFRFFCM